MKLILHANFLKDHANFGFRLPFSKKDLSNSDYPITHPTWEMVEYCLKALRDRGGFVNLDLREEDNTNTSSLSSSADLGNFLINFQLSKNDYEDIIYSYVNPNIELNTAQIEIGGNLWDASMVCRDFSIIVEIFREHFINRMPPLDLFDSGV